MRGRWLYLLGSVAVLVVMVGRLACTDRPEIAGVAGALVLVGGLLVTTLLGVVLVMGVPLLVFALLLLAVREVWRLVARPRAGRPVPGQAGGATTVS